MAAIDFPSSPTNGQVFTSGDKTWTYSTAVGAWRLQTQISAGATGATGATGTAATIAVGTVTTGAAGTSAIITNSGTSSAATFNFTIPRGDTGATGATGPQGPAGTGDVTSTVTNTFTTNQIISGSSASALLRITQTGTGNALLIEDSANPDSTPFIIDASGNQLLGTTALRDVGNAAQTVVPSQIFTEQGSGGLTAYTSVLNRNDTNAYRFVLAKTRGTAAGGVTALQNNDGIAQIVFAGADGTTVNPVAVQITSLVNGTVSTGVVPGRLLIQIANSSGTVTTRLDIDSAGRFGISASPVAGRGINFGIPMTGGVQPLGIFNAGAIQSDATAGAIYYSTWSNTAASAGAIPTIVHYQATQGTIGAGSTMGTQIGFVAANTLTGGSANWGFQGDIAAGTGRWNLYMSGTANNYFAGGLVIGTPSLTISSLAVAKAITGGTTAYGVVSSGTVQSDVTTQASGFISSINTAATAFTLGSLNHFAVSGVTTPGAGSTITNQYGYIVTSQLTGATNNYAFASNVAAATGRWNIYMGGTADNYMAGRLGVGATLTTGAMAQVTNTTAADTVFVAKGAASQTGDYFQLKDSAGVLNVFSVNANGNTNIQGNLEVGINKTADSSAYIDLIGDTTYTDYGLRILRSSGANGNTALYHRGTGGIYLIAQDAGVVAFSTSNTERMRINPTGSVAIGAGTFAGVTLRLGRNITGAAFSQAMFIDATIQADVTTRADMVWSNPTVAASVTSSGINHFYASSPAIGAGSTITSVAGYVAESNLGNNYSGTVTNAYAFMGNIAAGTNRWNLFMGGTATNYLAGRLGVGAGINSGAQVLLQSTSAADRTLIVKGAASQTALLTEWQNSAGTVLAYVAADGSSSFYEGDQNIIATSIFS